MSLTFLGHTFEEAQDFQRAYPKFASYVREVRAGADTPHKLEVAVYEKRKRAKKGRRMASYSITRKRG